MNEKIRDKILNLRWDEIILENSMHNDGRINSSINEKEVFNFLKKQSFFKGKVFASEKERGWYDFAINFMNGEEEIFIPVNIKVIEGGKNDNLNCKLGIFYSLTGKIPFFVNEIKWESFFEILSNEIQPNNKDYYFLVVNKNTKNVIFKGLKEINDFVENGNNLPFQCNFEKDEKKGFRNYKNFDDSKEHILKAFYGSIKKRTTIRDFFEKYLIDENGKIK